MDSYDAVILCCERSKKRTKHKCLDCAQHVSVTQTGENFLAVMSGFTVKILCDVCCWGRFGAKPAVTKEQAMRSFQTIEQNWNWRN